MKNNLKLYNYFCKHKSVDVFALLLIEAKNNYTSVCLDPVPASLLVTYEDKFNFNRFKSGVYVYEGNAQMLIRLKSVNGKYKYTYRLLCREIEYDYFCLILNKKARNC